MNGFFAMLSRMKYINRWGLMRCTRTETLSEHTLETAMLTHALIVIANARCGESLDAGQGVLFALYHDGQEIVTGDLPTPVKYNNDAIKNAYHDLEKQASDRLLSMLPDDLRDSFARCFATDARYEPYVKAADKLSAVIKCVEEEKSGNREFAIAKETCLSHPSLLLPAAQIFLREFLPAYFLTLDELEENK